MKSHRVDRQQKNGDGFTLIELLTAIVIVAILLALAVPSFKSYQANQEVRSVAADLLSALNFARSEAVKRAANITVSPVATNWADGWAVKTGAALELRKYAAVSGVTITSSAGSPTYSKDGRLSGAAGISFTVTPVGTTSVSSRCVKVAPSGKPMNRVGGCS
ncbi:MAG: GspH/FimT family pseudopilin [Pseudomonas sp.]